MAKSKSRSQLVITAIKQKIKLKREEIQRLEDEVTALESQLQLIEDRPDFLATILEALPDTSD